MEHIYKTGKGARLLGAVFGVAAAAVHAYAYALYDLKVWNGEIDGNVTSWGLFACEFLILLAYRDFSKDWAMDLLYVTCAVLGFVTFVMVCLKLYLSGIPIQTKLDYYDALIIVVNVFVLFMWMRFRDKDAPGIIDWLLQLTIVLDFIPIVRSTLANPSNEWDVPWGVWTIAYILQIFCVRWRSNGCQETETTTIHYIAWHLAMFGICHSGAAP